MGVSTLGDGTGIGVAGSGAMGVSTLGDGTGIGGAWFGENKERNVLACVMVYFGCGWLDEGLAL